MSYCSEVMHYCTNAHLVHKSADSGCTHCTTTLGSSAVSAEQGRNAGCEEGLVDRTNHGRTPYGKNAATCLGCLETRIRNPGPVQQSRTDNPRHPADARLATGDRLRASADTVSNTGSTQKVARLAAWGGARP